jgi:N-acyl-D-aspartate/D-glutamate deacylase
MVIFAMREDDIAYFMKQPWTMTSSDGGDGHPREYGTFPRKYTDYVLKRHTLSLPAFIHQSTGLPAEIYSLDHRGTLKAGNYADVLVFDPDHFAAKADYVHWDVLSEGVVDLLVNGKLAVDAGKMTEALSGRPLPHTPTPKSCM